MHIPVLQKEVIEFLAPKANENFIDCTIDGGGHALAILEKTSPNGKILGIDADPTQIENCKLKIENFKKRATLVCDNFVNLKTIVEKENLKDVSGILFDLGLSSWHLDESGRGFSFLRDESLDMRFDENSELTAEKILNDQPVEEIEKILKDYGEERFAINIAKKIVETRKIRPIKSTFQLVNIIKQATPSWYHFRKIHPATKAFQALRIAVNDELNNLEKVLPQALEVLGQGGRLAVISFHSLEDRIVKNFLRNNKAKLKILTKKPVSPWQWEIGANPRSRSAKLRAAIKI